jgi:formate hydrogenlyase subunit 3/multisubunit Na+/H+ antiporter MnhD subunit
MLLVVLGCVATLLALAVAGNATARTSVGTPLVYGGSLAVSAIALLAAVTGLAVGPATLWLPLGLPWIGVHFRLDALAAFFLAVVNFGAVAASLFALGYARHEAEPRRVLPFYPAFLAGMNLVVIADDAYTFLFAWELMSLASWALVMAHHRERDNARAGYIYLVMASFGTLALLLAFGMLAGPAGGYMFDAIRAAHPGPALATLVLALVLIGAGSKAGLVPLHVWLPLAHPAAPSHVSALMSGVMTKVAVYGFVRIVFDLLGVPTWWSGVVVLFLGGVTAVLGVLYALMEHDLKRLLAYHTVENIGIIFIGLGLALAFSANGLAAGAALALTAALFHVFNHSVFKSLLFFGAGAVLNATGERDMEHLGGLIHRMPVTSALFLVGCIAISALPPLNGFVSEWLTFQAILLRPDMPQWGLKIMIPADGLSPVVQAIAAARMPTQLAVPWLSIVPIESSRSSYNGLLIFLFIAASAWITAYTIHRFASRAVRRSPAWDCGFPDPRPQTQYTAGSFAQPIRRVFGAVVFQSHERVTMPPPGDLAAARIEKSIRDPVWDACYAPIEGAVSSITRTLNHLQFLTIRRYLAFVFIALVALLLMLAIWQ